MVQRPALFAGGVEGDLKTLSDLLLPDEFVEALGPQRHLFFRLDRGIEQ
jgi:hypothetical protein